MPTSAEAQLAASLLKRLHRCGDISAECCASACELLTSPTPLQLLEVSPVRTDVEAPLAFFRLSQDSVAGLLILLDVHGAAAQVTLHPTAGMLSLVSAGCTHFRVHRQRVTPGRVSCSPAAPRSAPRAEAFEEAGEWSGATYAAPELTRGELLATVPAHGLLCLRVEPALPPCPPSPLPLPRSSRTTALQCPVAGCAAGARALLLSSLLRLACRPPERSRHNLAAVTMRALAGAAAAGDEGRGLVVVWRRLRPVPHELMAPLGYVLATALHLALEIGPSSGEAQGRCRDFAPHREIEPRPTAAAEAGAGEPAGEHAGEQAAETPAEAAVTADEAPLDWQEAAQRWRRTVAAAAKLASPPTFAAPPLPPPPRDAGSPDLVLENLLTSPAGLGALSTAVFEEDAPSLLSSTYGPTDSASSGRSGEISPSPSEPEAVPCPPSPEPATASRAVEAAGGPAAEAETEPEDSEESEVQAEVEAELREVCAQLRGAACDGCTVLVSPEMGSLCTVGGLGVMVGNLACGLAAHGGSVAVIMPAYERRFASWRHATPLCDLVVPLGASRVEMQVLCCVERGVAVYLLRAPSHFVAPYHYGTSTPSSPWARLLHAVLLPRGALLLLQWLRRRQGVNVEAIISNDWVAALTAPYARHPSWTAACGGDGGALWGEGSWSEVPFVHVFHNLEEGYDGSVELSKATPLAALHLLPAHLLHEEGRPAALNLSRAALLCASQWATVSVGYRSQLLQKSRLAPLLRSFAAPFACASGIDLAARRRQLAPHGAHAEAKAALQRRCFGERGVRADVPLLCFVGRIASQKGVHLLLDVLPALLQADECQMLVCGQADPRDNYGQRCAAQMRALRQAYPLRFWAQPEVFFAEGPLASLGSDWGLMPSLFEPCGLVREEFFSAGTPIVCSRTGGLSDRVQPYCEASCTGNGLFLEEQTHQAVLAALKTALRLAREPTHHAALRRHALAAACDVAQTAWRWRGELLRLRTCLVLRQQPLV